MKKLLIIQTDGPYFLFECLKTLEKGFSALKDFEVTVLASKASLEASLAHYTPLVPLTLLSDETKIIKTRFDVSVNLSLGEGSYGLHSLVDAELKLGPYLQDGQLKVPDLWSTFLLTIKASAPFLTFPLQDIFKNILGIKKIQTAERRSVPVREIVWGLFNPQFFNEAEFTQLQNEIKTILPLNFIPRPDQVDLIADLSHTLYIGPASLEGVRLSEAGAQAIFIGSGFQGFNLLPRVTGQVLISTAGEKVKCANLVPFIESFIKTGKILSTTTYPVYTIEEDPLFGGFLKSANPSDLSYPAYQSHVVLWNFLLNLYDVNLDVTKCSAAQLDHMTDNQKVLQKLLRLHEYALSSVDTIYQEAKSNNASGETIDGHLVNIREIDEVMANLAKSHPVLRPFLDFYRIRRSQNGGNSLLEQAEHSLLTYTEEHHALNALNELFSVTLRKNEVSI